MVGYCVAHASELYYAMVQCTYEHDEFLQTGRTGAIFFLFTHKIIAMAASAFSIEKKENLFTYVM